MFAEPKREMPPGAAQFRLPLGAARRKLPSKDLAGKTFADRRKTADEPPLFARENGYAPGIGAV